MKLSRNPKIILLLIFLVALFLRTYKLDSIPIGMHGDEVSIGYTAYALLQTGRDLNGVHLPLAIDQFGDFRPAGYYYLDIPFVALLGLNNTAIRLPSAIFGALLVILIYLLSKELFKKESIALLSALLLALSPWHINISRATSEGVIAAFFVLAGMYCFVKAIRTKQHQALFVITTIICFCVSFLFYHAARFFVPAFFLPFAAILLLKEKFSKRNLLITGAVFILSISFLFILMSSIGKGTDRPLNVSIFNFPMGIAGLTQQIGEDGRANPIITRSFHNKLYYYGRIFLENYFMHLSGDFLFVNTGKPIRYIVPWSGNLYLFELPFLLFGSACLLVAGIKEKKYLLLIPLMWITFGAIPGGLSWEDIPNVQRVSFMIYGLVMVTAYGFVEVTSLFKNKRIQTCFIALCVILFTYNVIYFFHNYFYHSPIHEPWHRSAAIPEVVLTTNELVKKFDKIIMTMEGNNNLIHHLYYSKFDPLEYKALGYPKQEDGLTIGNIEYRAYKCPLEGDPNSYVKQQTDVVYLVKEDCKLPKNSEVLKVIRHPDGTTAYHVVRLTEIPPEILKLLNFQ
jgi:4-amino-4-deoxy-L-arabinose transferase-like glycosyltransferase